MCMGLMPEGTEHLPLFRRIIGRGKVRGQYFISEGIGYSMMSDGVCATGGDPGGDPARYDFSCTVSDQGLLQRYGSQ